MQYVNPFKAFNLTEDLESIDNKTLRRLKKRYLAEFELQESTTIQINGKTFDKNGLIFFLEQLQDKNTLHNHFKIFNNKPLLDFLENGNLSIFWQNKMQLFNDESKDFKELIESYYIEQYDLALFVSIEKKEHSLTKTLINNRLLVSDVIEHRCFQNSGIYLTRQIRGLEKLLETNLRRKRVHDILDEYIVERLNVLPAYFSFFRIKLAEFMAKLALKFNNEYHQVTKGQQILKMALRLKTNEHTKYRLQYILDQFNGYPEEYWGKGKPDDEFYVNSVTAKAGRYFVVITFFALLQFIVFGC
jgi:hypothetical protein